MLCLDHADSGKGFDFGKVAQDYAKYRDIYSARFFKTILQYNIGTAGQRVLDLGTGSGVICRHMASVSPGAKWVGADISTNQIEAAKSEELVLKYNPDWSGLLGYFQVFLSFCVSPGLPTLK